MSVYKYVYVNYDKKTIEAFVINYIVDYVGTHFDAIIDNVLDDSRFWDRHYEKYADEWLMLEEAGEEPLEIMMNLFGAVYDSNNGYVYDYPYDIAYAYAGRGWVEELARRDYASQQAVVDAFIGTRRRDLFKIVVDYVKNRIMELEP